MFRLGKCKVALALSGFGLEIAVERISFMIAYSRVVFYKRFREFGQVNSISYRCCVFQKCRPVTGACQTQD